MKNTVTIRREFGEVILETCLPSLEDFARKLTNNTFANIYRGLDEPNKQKFYNEKLQEVYSVDIDTAFRDFHPTIEQHNLLRLENSWGATYFCRGGYLNLVPFISRGIGTDKILKFYGVYNEESLKRAMKTLEHLVKYACGYRKPVVLNFEIEANENNEPINIKL
jgi:hypothetical protein